MADHLEIQARLQADSSDNETINTSASTAGNSVFSRLRRAVSVRDQAEEVAALATAPTSFADYPLIKAPDGCNYVLEKHFKPPSRQRTSWVNRHGYALIRVVSDKMAGNYWLCHHCERVMTAAASTNAAKHLGKQHNISSKGQDPAQAPAPSNKRKSIGDLLEAQVKRPKIGAPLSYQETFQRALIAWMADSDIPFSMVANKRFRDLINLIAPDSAAPLLPKHGSTARGWLNNYHKELLQSVKAEIHNTPHKIHIAFDLWTSGSLAMMAIVGHFLDSAGVYQTRLLSLPRLLGAHSGANQAQLVFQILNDFEIKPNKLGRVQIDNAGNNDTGLEALLGHLNPDLAPDDLENLTPDYRVRCVGHILNLVAKAFLGSNNAEAIATLSPDSLERATAEEEVALLEQWRRLGPVGKLHYAVQYVRHSPQRREVFRTIAGGVVLPEEEEEFGAFFADPAIAHLELRTDNATRWHSVYSMIERAVLLKDPLDVFIHRYSNLPSRQSPYHRNLILTPSDWIVLLEMKSILEPFKRITKKFEGNNPRFSDVVIHLYSLYHDLTTLYAQYSAAYDNPGLEFSGPEIFPPEPERSPSPEPEQRPRRRIRLPHRFQDYEVEMPGLQRANEVVIELGDLIPDYVDLGSWNTIQASLGLAIQKLGKYLEELDQSPLYWAAQILHPGRKLRWIDRFFGNKERTSEIKTQFLDFFERAAPQDNASIPAQPLEANQQPVGGFGPDFFDPPEAFLVVDEVAIYLSEPVFHVKDPIQWWLANQRRFPRLAVLALDLLSVPPSTCECERVFSQAKLVVGLLRHGTHWDTLCMLQSIKNWQRNRVS